ncbi:hypothetical protein [Spirillospora albida]|uniref:hypothetical protein n=1 Tax=Spirillospora albida TaxID=58123 RepID=UPI0004BF878A|nr:hypothetical protein [Spirillospora albida]
MTASTPEQDEHAGSRAVRRRLTFGVAEGLAGLPGGMSPWQRAYEAWRTAGVPWGHDLPAEPVPNAAGDPAAANRAVANRAAVRAPAAEVPAAPVKARRRRGRRAGAVVLAGVVLAGGGAAYVATRDEGTLRRAPAPGAVVAERAFAVDPAAKTDGLVQELASIAAAGGTVVAVGHEGGAGRERAEFLHADRGTWRLARVRNADGAEPPVGDRAQLVAGAAGGWVALGRAAGGAVVSWTSADGGTWVRQPAGGFTPADRVNGLVRAEGGFVAVGSAGAGGAVVWSSADGRAWQRVPVGKDATAFDRVAASGRVVVAHGTFARKVTKKKGKKKVTATVRGDGLWRSADGGRTWAPVGVPQAQGSHGPTKGLVAGPGGVFATARDGKRATGKGKKRKTSRFGVLFTSPDGRTWKPAGQFGAERFAGVDRFGGSADGFAAVVRVEKGPRAVLGSTDGKTWRRQGTVGPPQVNGLTVAGGSVALAGRRGDDAFLSGVDLRAVPGAVRPERTVRAVAAGPGGLVAVGGTNGGVAVWSAPDGARWTRAGVPMAAGSLADAVHGPQGWVAVGRGVAGALVLASPDGRTWSRPSFPPGPAPTGVASGKAGYVAVGPGGAWRSGDLKGWRRAGVDGTLADVVATSKGYAAVGAKGTAPAVWTSPDGLKWTAVKLPADPATGPLTQVAARGDVVVAVGTGPAPLVSPDGGGTWNTGGAGVPPGAAGLTAVTATATGFTVAGTAGGRGAALWSWSTGTAAGPGGASWRRLPVPGLDGPGDRRLTALSGLGKGFVAVGAAADHRGEAPLLYRAP